MKTWPLKDAKAHLSELVTAAQKAPQYISKRGKKTVVVLSIKDYQKLVQTKPPLATFLQHSPLSEIDIEIERDTSPIRTVKL